VGGELIIPVHVTDEDQSPAAAAMSRRHEVTALPTMVVAEGSGGREGFLVEGLRRPSAG